LSSRQLLSMSHNEYLFPKGTFRDRMNLTSQAQCTACTAEHYCNLSSNVRTVSEVVELQ